MPRSSGEKTVTGTASARSRRDRTGWRFTWARERPWAATSASTSSGSPARVSSARITARSRPVRTIDSRWAPRKERWVPR